LRNLSPEKFSELWKVLIAAVNAGTYVIELQIVSIIVMYC
jgi:hypothetical protein